MKALIIGCGRVGSTVAKRLASEGWAVTAVDEKEGALARPGAGGVLQSARAPHGLPDVDRDRRAHGGREVVRDTTRARAGGTGLVTVYVLIAGGGKAGAN